MRELMRVNMSDLSITMEPLPEKWSRYGGRALTSALVFAEVPAGADALGPENKLVFAPGLLGGTNTPNGGRLSVGAKSPLTGGIKESNSGGQAAHALGKMGLAAVIVEGMPADPGAAYMLVIDPDKSARLERVDAWKGMGNYAVTDAIKAMRPEGDRYATITNGPAGEMGLKASGIAVSDPHGYPNRFAGRGGLGAVMGSKGLKAIVVSDAGLKYLDHADKDAFQVAMKTFANALTTHPVSGQGLPTYGTNVLANIINEAGGYPTRNFSDGRFEGVEGISGETQREMTLARAATSSMAATRAASSSARWYWYDKDGQLQDQGP